MVVSIRGSGGGTRHPQDVEQLRPQGSVPVQKRTLHALLGFDDHRDHMPFQACNILILPGERGWLAFVGISKLGTHQHRSYDIVRHCLWVVGGIHEDAVLHRQLL